MSIRHEKTETTRSGHILSHWGQKLLFFLLFINQRVVSLFFLSRNAQSSRLSEVRSWLHDTPCMSSPSGFGPNKVIVSRPPGATISVELPERFRSQWLMDLPCSDMDRKQRHHGTDRHCRSGVEPIVLMCVCVCCEHRLNTFVCLFSLRIYRCRKTS